jgi:rhodanese-related sulfurtransferase
MQIARIHLLILGLLFSLVAAADSDFPGRAKFPKVAIYEMSQLKDTLDKVVVVDTRSQYEFDTLRIKGAVNLPVASKLFEEGLAKLRASTTKPIVFYCNGRTCFKSYIAAKKAREADIDNTFAFDAGIFEWARANPDQAVLLGKSPVNTGDIIPTQKFKARLLDPDSFSDKATLQGRTAMVLDIRDKYQRSGVGFYPGKERWVSLNQKEKLNRYIQKAQQQNKTLLIYDEVGKQVRWLQYAIEKAGVKNYFFMDKGASGYYKNLANWDKPS